MLTLKFREPFLSGDPMGTVFDEVISSIYPILTEGAINLIQCCSRCTLLILMYDLEFLEGLTGCAPGLPPILFLINSATEFKILFFNKWLGYSKTRPRFSKRRENSLHPLKLINQEQKKWTIMAP